MYTVIDDTDKKILEALKENGRMSYSEIGEKLGMSRTAVKNRITELEKNDVILGYRVVIGSTSAAVVKFIITIEAQPIYFDYTMSILNKQEYITQIYSTTGDCHVVAFGFAPNMEELDAMHQRLRSIFNGLRRYKLEVVASTFKDVDGGIKYEGPSEEVRAENATESS